MVDREIHSRHWILASDFALIVISPVLATMLRKGNLFPFEVSAAYWTLSIAIGLLAYRLFHLDRVLLAYLSFRDARRVLTFACLVSLSATFGSFLVDRMDAVARSEPLLQVLILFIGMYGARATIRHLKHGDKRALHAVDWNQQRNALIVGVNEVSDVYLKIIEKVGRPSVRIIGLLSLGSLPRGLSQRGYEVCGRVADLPELMTRYEIHGVPISTLVLAQPLDTLPAAVVSRIEALVASGLELQRLEALAALIETRLPSRVGQFAEPPRLLGTWPGKRLADVAVSGVMLVLLAPLMVIVSGLIAVELGRPVLFWQVRPGLHGRPVRLYKLRTMGAPTDSAGRLRDDAERVTLLGYVLRRSRIDELPQLFNVLLGDMSLVGPRPLLPRDLPGDTRTRCRMRPGLTGWAQVNGGKLVPPEDKLALDLWYADHASPLLDLKILVKTAIQAVRGDRPSVPAIGDARANRFARHAAE